MADPLDPLIGAFGVVNALRPLQGGGGRGRVLLAFSPPDCCEYQEILNLRWVGQGETSIHGIQAAAKPVFVLRGQRAEH